MRDFADDSMTHVERLPACGMVTVRGTLADRAFASALESCGVSVPEKRQVARCEQGTALWMSPDELLVLCAPATDASLADRLGTALAGHHHLALAVGDARARFSISGPGARIALAKLAPVDMARFTSDEVRRTRIAQVPAAFWMTGPDAFELVCFRSVAEYAHAALARSARHLDEISLP